MNTKLLKHSIKALIFTLFSLASVLPALAQDCNCTYTVQPGEWQVDGSKLAPGSVVCIPAGVRNSLVLKNMVGSATNPIIIKNCGGKATIKNSTSASYGLKIQNSKYFRLTGSGVASIEQGLEIDGAHIGLSLEALSTNFEVDHVKVMNTGAIAIAAKTDPTCNSATWKGNFTMRDVSFHDNLVTNVKQEGFYIGSSHYTSGVTKSCNGTSVRLWEHPLIGVRVYKNRVIGSGRDGIQVGGAIENTEIYDNYVENAGFGQESGHKSGIQINPGTVAKTYNNTVVGGTGYAIFVTGDGGNVVYNNVVLNPKEGGIFCDDRGTTPGTRFVFINNTMVNPGGDGIRIYSKATKGNIFSNNIVVRPGGKYVDKLSSVDMSESNNLFTQDINSVKFVNVANKDFRLQQGSPAIDAGMNAGSFGVATDFDRLRRPSGNAYDIGSFEFQGAATSTPVTVSAGPNQTLTLPSNSTTLKGTASGGTISSYAWTKVSGPAATLSGANTATLSLSNLVEGTYVFRLTAKNTTNATGSGDVTVTVNAGTAITQPSQPTQPGTTANAIRINCGGAAFTTTTGEAFSADNFFSSGSVAYTNSNITTFKNTSNHTLYKSERNAGANLAAMKYNIPVANGTYTVKLHFAEIWYGATGGSTGGTGKRTINVNIEGNRVLTNLDINAEVGPMAAVVKTYTATVNDGNVTLDFGSGVDRAKVSAIEVLPQETSTTTASLSVNSLTLINASTHQAVKQMVEGEVINFGTLRTNKINISANTAGTVGSIVFILNGKVFSTENVAPYTLVGDRATSTGITYNAWTPAAGTYTLTVKVYSGANGSGTEGKSLTIRFSIVSSPGATSFLDIDSVSSEDSATAKEKTVTSATSNDLEAVNAIVAYPNPFADKITINFGLVTSDDIVVTVVDQLGRLVYEDRISVREINSHVDIDMDAVNMTPGFYILKLNSRSINNKVIKMIKQ